MSIADVAIIGAGVVGCAVARRFALAGAKIVLVEKGADLLSGASKANSAILHTGFDAPAESLELACMQEGRREYLQFHKKMNLPLLETGAMVVAWSEAERAALDGIEQRAIENGVADVRRLDAAAIRAREPELSHQALEALLVPGEHVIDPWSPFLAYLIEAKRQGAELRFSTEVLGGERDGDVWKLKTSTGDLRARTIVNCAGLYGDRIERLLLGDASFEIRPRKGQFVVFDKAAAQLFRTIILPVPNERTKGVVLCRTAFGNVLVGPTAEEQEDRARATVEEATLKALVARAVEMIPGLADIDVTAVYAGLRPATDDKAYRIRVEADRGWISLGGVRSTGLTASLGLASFALKLYETLGARHQPVEPTLPRVPNIAEHLPRDWERPGHGGIVCHCELVTRREIDAALSGPVPAGDFGGLKRRTRCGMGRCQGFNCNARLASLTAGRLAVPLAEGEAA